MISKGNSNYYKKVKTPVRIINSKKRISNITQKETNFGAFRYFLKKAGNLILILFIISIPVYLLSAFESHVVNVTARICSPSETRTMGFWKNHPNAYDPFCLPQYLGDEPVSTIEEVNQVFKDANADIMRDMLKGQLLAMKFNICGFGIDAWEGEEFDGKTLGKIVEWADNLLRDANYTREEQEFVKNLLDYANNLHQVKYCSITPSWSIVSDFSEEEILTAELLTDGEVAGETITEEILTEEPPAEEPPAEEPPTEEPPLEEPPAEEPPPEETPTEEEPPIEETLAEKQPPTEEAPTEEQPPVEEPPAEEPPAEESLAEEPPAEEPPAEEPPTEEPPVEEPPAEEPPAEEPPAEEPPVE